MTDALEVFRHVRDRWVAAFRARNSAAIIALYHDDALFFGSTPELAAGKAEIRAYFDALPASLRLVDFPDAVARQVADGVIAAAGFWRFDFAGKELDFRLAWTLVDANGRWLIAQHHAALTPSSRAR